MKRSQAGSVITKAEREFFMTEFNFKSLINEYMTVAILFGYMTLFISALPGAAFVTLVNYNTHLFHFTYNSLL
jgi:hypothetical protein